MRAPVYVHAMRGRPVCVCVCVDRDGRILVGLGACVSVVGFAEE